MKKMLIAALVVFTATVAAESTAAPKVDDAIQQVLVELDRCFSANDAKCVGEMFVEDATYSEPTGGAKIVKGRAEILKVLTESMGAVKKAGWTLTHNIERVRMIGEDHVFVDTTVKIGGMKAAKDEPGGAGRDSYRAVVIMVLEGGKWLCEDLRSYIIGPAESAKKDAAPASENESAPPAKNEPAPPTQG